MTFVDEAGEKLLTEMHRNKEGLIGSGGMNEAVLNGNYERTKF